MSILIWNQGTVPAHPPIFCSWKFPPQIFHCENGAQRPRKRMGKCSSSSTSRPQPLPNLSTHSGPFFLQENRPFSMEKKNVAIFKTKKNLKSDLKLLPRNPTWWNYIYEIWCHNKLATAFPVETPRWTFRMLLFVTNSKELKPEPKRIELFTFLHRWHL